MLKINMERVLTAVEQRSLKEINPNYENEKKISLLEKLSGMLPNASYKGLELLVNNAANTCSGAANNESEGLDQLIAMYTAYIEPLEEYLVQKGPYKVNFILSSKGGVSSAFNFSLDSEEIVANLLNTVYGLAQKNSSAVNGLNVLLQERDITELFVDYSINNGQTLIEPLPYCQRRSRSLGRNVDNYRMKNRKWSERLAYLPVAATIGMAATVFALIGYGFVTGRATEYQIKNGGLSHARAVVEEAENDLRLNRVFPFVEKMIPYIVSRRFLSREGENLTNQTGGLYSLRDKSQYQAEPRLKQTPRRELLKRKYGPEGRQYYFNKNH